eukprot:scaffold7092_cov262-Pinguiococcus_pyrenoidosus.AAC.53
MSTCKTGREVLVTKSPHFCQRRTSDARTSSSNRAAAGHAAPRELQRNLVVAARPVVLGLDEAVAATDVRLLDVLHALEPLGEGLHGHGALLGPEVGLVGALLGLLGLHGGVLAGAEAVRDVALGDGLGIELLGGEHLGEATDLGLGGRHGGRGRSTAGPSELEDVGKRVAGAEERRLRCEVRQRRGETSPAA